jgi:DNA-binding transcriptional LysR family regulator
MRPVILRIAVGPANSDDIKVVQALTQAFTHAHSHVRLRPMQTDGATASAQALADGKADLAIIRGDLEVPKNAQAVATLRKNVAVLWVPPSAKGRPEDHENTATRRTPHRRRRAHRGQYQPAQGDPAAIWRGPDQDRDGSVPGQ